jgi:hypothetical protein
MSCVCILTPIVIAAWPAFSSAVVAAATSLGYRVVAESLTELQERRARVKQDQSREIQLEIAQSELVTNQLGRDQKICVSRDGITVTFSRDQRGRASLCVAGSGQADGALRALGEELSKRVVQKYVYQRLMDEIRARQFVVVEEEVQEDNAIRVKVRHWS